MPALYQGSKQQDQAKGHHQPDRYHYNESDYAYLIHNMLLYGFIHMVFRLNHEALNFFLIFA
jgi:hypothetical protein